MNRHPITPDGRYFVVRGRLWRQSNPELDADERVRLVAELTTARREVEAARRKGDAATVVKARRRVNAVKVPLGKRGPVWWRDGAPDFNRHMARSTPYADWFAVLPPTSPEARSM